tara:strand:+ start:150 stop:452 length:303 start_codon:yes stop_codon:yes gene_type:complete
MFSKIKKNFFLIVSSFLIIYFFFNLLDGERGLFSFFKKKNILKDLKKEEFFLVKEIEGLNFKNNLLIGNPDKDYIEILIREKFMFGKKEETLYIIEKDEN